MFYRFGRETATRQLRRCARRTARVAAARRAPFSTSLARASYGRRSIADDTPAGRNAASPGPSSRPVTTTPFSPRQLRASSYCTRSLSEALPRTTHTLWHQRCKYTLLLLLFDSFEKLRSFLHYCIIRGRRRGGKKKRRKSLCVQIFFCWRGNQSSREFLPPLFFICRLCAGRFFTVRHLCATCFHLVADQQHHVSFFIRISRIS